MQSLIQKQDDSQPIQLPKTASRTRKTLRERFVGFDGDFVFSEWDTGVEVGREILELDEQALT